MKLRREELGRYYLAIAAGFLLTLSFPKFNVAGLAWIAPGAILATAAGFAGAAAFRIGFMAGFGYHLSVLYWLLYIPMGLPWKGVVILGWIALSAFLALYQGVWVWLVWRLLPPNSDSREPNRFPLLRLLASIPLSKRFSWALNAAVLWVALEMIQARFLSGFPWGLLGVSQYEMLPLIQVSAVAGVYGVSFLIVWFSAGLLCCVACLLCNTSARRTWMADLFAPVLAGSVLFAVGMNRVIRNPPAPREIRAALIQPSIPQTMIWNEKESLTRFEQVLVWSKKALAEKPKPDLLIWPEAAVPGFFLWDTNAYKGKSVHDWITGLAQEQKVWMIIGADDADPPADGKVNYFNSSFLISPEGEILAKYRKRRLVIFGEYVPFSRWLPFLSKMVQSEGEFTPGDKPGAFRLDALNIVSSVLICFEDVFPNVTRESVEADTDFLVNLTNNGWFGESAAQWQHAASAVFRAVENDMPLVRCANNGLTCWVDRRGGLHNVYFETSRNVYEAGYKIVEIPIERRTAGKATFYHKYGDVFGWSCCAIAGLSSGISALRARRQNRNRVIDGAGSTP